MKKLVLLFLLFSGALVAFPQVVLNEDFSSGQMPPAGWNIDGQTSNWSVRQSANAGGVAPEAGMSWSPQFNGTTRLISPEIDLTGNSTVLLQFRQMIDHYSGNYQIGVATRSNGGSWTNAWTRTVTASQDAEQVSVPVSDANVNSSSFQFCIFFSGSSYNINDWYIDDVVLTIPAETDGAVTGINVPTYFTGSQDVKGTITNMGITTISSFNYHWQIDDGEVHTNYVVGQNLTLGQVYSFTATDQVSLDAGIYTLRIWVSNVNGSTGPDGNPANDTLTKVLRIPTQTVPRKPMFEEFTSSTCSPCASFNNSVFNPFIAQNGDDLVLVKYQMNWPGSGDPYYTEEGGQRRAYYGVNAVPMLFVDGKNTATSSAAVNTAFTNSLAKPAFVSIEGTYTINGSMVAINADLTAYTDIDDATLYVVIFEGVTTGNHSTNGETEFHHVMMRILPDGNGSSAILQSGVPVYVSDEVDMTGTHVEEMDDLQVAVFLQDNVTKDIFQAAYATLTGALVNITPQNNATEVLVDQPLVINFSEPVRLIGGEAITGENASSVISLENLDAKGTPVLFTAVVSNNNSTITLTPDEDLQMVSEYMLTVSPVENMNGMATLETSSHFYTQTNVGIPALNTQDVTIYPNPANELLNVVFGSGLGTVNSVVVYNSAGVRVPLSAAGSGQGSFVLDTSRLPAGIYVLRLNGSLKSAATRFIVNN